MPIPTQSGTEAPVAVSEQNTSNEQSFVIPVSIDKSQIPTQLNEAISEGQELARKQGIKIPIKIDENAVLKKAEALQEKLTTVFDSQDSLVVPVTDNANNNHTSVQTSDSLENHTQALEAVASAEENKIKKSQKLTEQLDSEGKAFGELDKSVESHVDTMKQATQSEQSKIAKSKRLATQLEKEKKAFDELNQSLETHVKHMGDISSENPVSITVHNNSQRQSSTDMPQQGGQLSSKAIAVSDGDIALAKNKVAEIAKTLDVLMASASENMRASVDTVQLQ